MVNMAAKASSLQLLKSSPRRIALLPDFLVPALSTLHPSRNLSNTLRCASRIGSASVSVPPEVHLRLIDPPKTRKLVTRIEPPRILEIEGPLGGPYVPKAESLKCANDACRQTVVASTTISKL